MTRISDTTLVGPTTACPETANELMETDDSPEAHDGSDQECCSDSQGFFRRSIQQKIQYRPCTKNQQCSILRINRNRCQYCRLKKCIAVGMSRDGKYWGSLHRARCTVGFIDRCPHHSRTASPPLVRLRGARPVPTSAGARIRSRHSAPMTAVTPLKLLRNPVDRNPRRA